MSTRCSFNLDTTNDTARRDVFKSRLSNSRVTTDNNSTEFTAFFVEQQRISSTVNSNLNKALAKLLVQLEEVEEEMDNLQQLRSDLLAEIANFRQQKE